MEGRPKARKAAAAAIALSALALAAIAALVLLRGSAAAPEPSPGGGAAEPVDGRWAEVDWGYWLDVNPDVVGWVQIPGTEVSQPIVQARPEDPDYYLSHDVYGSWNPWGAVYLDAECEGGLFGSPNAVVYGHHMSDGSMLAAVADYLDPAWAEGHADVLVQSPEERVAYKVRLVDLADNATLPKRCAFDGRADFDAWYASCLDSAAVALDAEERPDRVLSLVTCSYTRYSDERTVAVCSRDVSQPATESYRESVWGVEAEPGQSSEGREEAVEKS